MTAELTEAQTAELNQRIHAIRAEVRRTDVMLALAALNVISAELIANHVQAADHSDLVGRYAGQLRDNVRQIGLLVGGHGPQVVH